MRQRWLAVFIATTFACVALALASARAGTVGSLSATITNASGAPIAGAQIDLRSSNAAFRSSSGPDGRVTFDALPPDTYQIDVSAAGYRRYSTAGVVVTADLTLNLAVALHQPTAALARPPPAPPPPPPAGGESGGGGVPPLRSPVHRSLLGLFNASHPVHTGNEPYYGRYSYVLLQDGDARQKSTNAAFVTKLVDLFAASGSTISYFSGAHRDALTPHSYNIFFFPVGQGTTAIEVAAHTGAAKAILDAYDFQLAGDVRDAYCGAENHANRSLCAPLAAGPVLLTFLSPLPDNLAGAQIPAAFAYDFTGVPVEQFGEPLQTVQREIAVPSGIAADRVLPPDLAVRVAKQLDTLSTAISTGLSGVQVWIDKGFGTPHGG